VKRLGNSRSVSEGASSASNRPASRRFGSASLSIVGAPQLGGGTFGGRWCQTALYNHLDWDDGSGTTFPAVQAIASSN
jgi:hypothetical protein